MPIRRASLVQRACEDSPGNYRLGGEGGEEEARKRRRMKGPSLLMQNRTPLPLGVSAATDGKRRRERWKEEGGERLPNIFVRRGSGEDSASRKSPIPGMLRTTRRSSRSQFSYVHRIVHRVAPSVSPSVKPTPVLLSPPFERGRGYDYVAKGDAKKKKEESSRRVAAAAVAITRGGEICGGVRSL